MIIIIIKQDLWTYEDMEFACEDINEDMAEVIYNIMLFSHVNGSNIDFLKLEIGIRFHYLPTVRRRKCAVPRLLRGNGRATLLFRYRSSQPRRADGVLFALPQDGSRRGLSAFRRRCSGLPF